MRQASYFQVRTPLALPSFRRPNLLPIVPSAFVSRFSPDLPDPMRTVPTNLKDRDAFHLTIEEYLLALTDFTQELSRLATNAVTLGDFELPMTISTFIKDLFAGFQLLNLKNDILRRRSDAVKYDLKRVEDVVYDLSLRGLVSRPAPADADMKSDS